VFRVNHTHRDPANKRGGKFHLKVRKGLASRFWESLLLAVIGEQFGEYSNEICGVVVSMRNTEDVLSLWTRNYCGDPSSEVFQKIRDGFRLGLKIPAFIPIDYKKHDTHHQLAGPNEVPQLTAPPSVHVPPQTGALQQQQQQQQHLPAWKGNKEWRG
jgi:translation initiation factor 4E